LYPLKKRRSVKKSDRGTHEPSESSEEDKEEEGWIDTLVEGILESKNYRNREENIMKFLKEYLSVKIYNMEYYSKKEK
jgi:hypothetical protein